MPGGDRTGPAGLGPMSGRGAGYCAGYRMPGLMNPVRGWGFFGRGGGGFGPGRGFGPGHGHRNIFWATERYDYWPGAGAYPYSGAAVTPQQEAEALKNQVKYMQDSMNALNKRIGELERSPTQTEE